MASWLKVAEDLLEVVDRRAKLVASELSDEQSGSQASEFNGLEVKSIKLKSKEKGQPRTTVGKIRKNAEAEQKQILQEEKVDKVDSTKNNSEVSLEVLDDARKDKGISNAASSIVAKSFEVENDTNGRTVIPTIEKYDEITYSLTNDTSSVAKFEDVLERTSSSQLKDDVPEMDGNLLADINHTGSAVVNTSASENRDGQETELTIFPEVPSNGLVENKFNSSLMKVQDQIEEAQGLLKATVSIGHSKEARLAKVCAGLSSRLQEYKSENSQLEELLIAERELSSSYEARIKQLQQDLSAVKAVATRAETNMDEALAAKNTEIEFLVAAVDTLKKQLCTSEGKVESLQANLEALMRSRELSESRMIHALREELEIVERRAEEERAAHNATKMAAVEREVELEHRAVEASNALSSTQRIADESTYRAAELEHKVALLEVECASLTHELQELEARNHRGQKKASEESSQILQVQAWQEEVERARHSQREAENKNFSMEAELQKMRVVIAGMKRDAEHYSRQEHMELEKRYRELTDLLYHKQTQLEAMASEKAAASIQLEKELKQLQETRVEAERSGTLRRSSALWEEDTDIKALEPLPLYHRHMTSASIQLQRAAKLLDSGAVRATRFLWRYPFARVLLLIYLVFVHLFLMYLLHSLQAQADDFSSRELAASMGLGNSSLP